MKSTARHWSAEAQWVCGGAVVDSVVGRWCHVGAWASRACHDAVVGSGWWRCVSVWEDAVVGSGVSAGGVDCGAGVDGAVDAEVLQGVPVLGVIAVHVGDATPVAVVDAEREAGGRKAVSLTLSLCMPSQTRSSQCLQAQLVSLTTRSAMQSSP